MHAGKHLCTMRAFGGKEMQEAHEGVRDLAGHSLIFPGQQRPPEMPFRQQKPHLKPWLPELGFALSIAPTSSKNRSCSSSLRKSMSLEEMMPTKRLPIRPVSVIGIPQNPCRALASNTSRTRSLGLRTTGSVMNPCSYFWKGW